MTEFHSSCSEDGTELTWYWTGVPTDDREPGLDNYFVQVVDTVTGEPIGWYPGAEDNAWGEPYTVTVTPGRDIYVQVANEAAGFSFETDVVVSCPAPIPTPTTTTTPSDPVLPFLILIFALVRRFFG
jgi:hypothetical protein